MNKATKLSAYLKEDPTLTVANVLQMVSALAKDYEQEISRLVKENKILTLQNSELRSRLARATDHPDWWKIGDAPSYIFDPWDGRRLDKEDPERG